MCIRDRKYPLRRFGERGQDRWERISWDEAYDEITERVLAIKEEHGSESIVVVHGTGRNIGWQVPYFASACMETPNVSTFGFTGFACYLPRMIGTSVSYTHLCPPSSGRRSCSSCRSRDRRG